MACKPCGAKKAAAAKTSKGTPVKKGYVKIQKTGYKRITKKTA